MKKNLQILLILAFWLLPTTFVMAQAKQINLRTMSYNVNGLPWPLKANKAVLFKEMAKVIQEQRKLGTAPQILALQEGFRDNVSHFVENAGYKYIAKGPNSKQKNEDGDHGGAVTNSGLYILSDFPIIVTDKVTFGDDCAGSDCYANKGVLYVQVDMPNVGLVDVFNTHFNSMKSSGAEVEVVYSTQEKQLNITKAFIKRHNSNDRPALLLGDTNIKASRANYKQMLDIFLPMYDAGQFCLAYPKHCPLGENTVIDELLETPDHVFYKSSTKFNVFPSYAAKSMRQKVEDRPLSDHLALVTHYIFYKK